MTEQRLNEIRTLGDGIRDYDAVVIRQGTAYAAEWDAEAEQAMPLTDEDGDYIPVTLDAELLTPREAAILTGTNESTWRYRLIDGRVPGAFKKGKQWLIPRSSVGENTMDRVAQVDWLRSLASDLVASLETNNVTADEVVAFHLENTADMPEWFDSHDRNLLVEFVESAL